MKKLLLVLAFCSVSIAQAQYTLIPDVNFEKKLIALKHDDVQDGKVLTANISLVSSLNVSNSQISDLTGIQDFKSLTNLDCSNNLITELNFVDSAVIDPKGQTEYFSTFKLNNNKLAKLTFSGINNIKSLDCSYNLLTELDLKGLKTDYIYTILCNNNKINSFELPIERISKDLELNCSYNELKILDINGFSTIINGFNVSHNQLDVLDMSQTLSIICYKDIDFSFNNLKNLNFNSDAYIHGDNFPLNLSHNQFTNLNFLNLNNSINAISKLDVSFNQLQEFKWKTTQGIDEAIDVSSNPLKVINIPFIATIIHDCLNLEMINIRDGYCKNNIYSFDLSNTPNLKYVCVDDNISECPVSESEYIKDNNNFSNCNCSPVIGNYCSFKPGGTFYTVQGTSRFDSNSNGCDTNDRIIPNLRFSVANETKLGSIISNSTGNYNIPLQFGNYKLAPVIENPTYFIASPASFTIDFPAQTSPLTQDICITPNGVHHDVEVVLMPKGNAVPGFETNYNLLYKNKGNQTESGQITIAFDDSLMDFVSASITPLKVENGLITFDYSAIQPFESESINLVFKMNKPTDIPALNNGDVLTFVASISGNKPEETPLDNVSTLKQTVLNSFDPNDKTCLEGNTVTPELVGQYVHYVVRFENTGTLEARNIVVKDMIDTAKFDVSSLIVTNSSHSCVTKISDTNKVEFIFENINLPFDNATNDGYIAFKIKTLPSLKVGDTFSNTADIFFDYNFPITTNEAKTTVEVLSTSDFAFENYFSLYPNPAKNTVSLTSKNSIEVKNINIFNTLRQLVLSIPNAQTVSNFDVSRLNTGTYFVKIVTNKGTSTTKFIKE